VESLRSIGNQLYPFESLRQTFVCDFLLNEQLIASPIVHFGLLKTYPNIFKKGSIWFKVPQGFRSLSDAILDIRSDALSQYVKSLTFQEVGEALGTDALTQQSVALGLATRTAIPISKDNLSDVFLTEYASKAFGTSEKNITIDSLFEAYVEYLAELNPKTTMVSDDMPEMKKVMSEMWNSVTRTLPRGLVYDTVRRSKNYPDAYVKVMGARFRAEEFRVFFRMEALVNNFWTYPRFGAFSDGVSDYANIFGALKSAAPFRKILNSVSERIVLEKMFYRGSNLHDGLVALVGKEFVNPVFLEDEQLLKLHSRFSRLRGLLSTMISKLNVAEVEKAADLKDELNGVEYDLSRTISDMIIEIDANLGRRIESEVDIIQKKKGVESHVDRAIELGGKAYFVAALVASPLLIMLSTMMDPKVILDAISSSASLVASSQVFRTEIQRVVGKIYEYKLTRDLGIGSMDFHFIFSGLPTEVWRHSSESTKGGSMSACG